MKEIKSRCMGAVFLSLQSPTTFFEQGLTCFAETTALTLAALQHGPKTV
jgi:hypothetical protein